MPFVPQSNRDAMASGMPPITVGDKCYLAYKKIMGQWKESPRWTSIHIMFRDTFGVTDDKAAEMLAFLVFFSLHGVDYELDKRDENGDIE